ncbi:PHP domain-containing protein [Candidatus Methylomirabilis sp.]|uniref:PHP domain-containing protein n=1 Tax=Candidatus Methylomirabilis tolerans TaxID=3123416 RepID=A0AAJ1EJF8_9BACT|nr:PHP domain-containing protein [Candidatus Methylomirabilis sp.]
MRLIDLHTHSTASDGVLSPQGLVRFAKDSGISVLAVTDHDTLEGLPTAMAEGQRIGLQVIAGVEITAHVGDLEIHILGHFIDPDDNRLVEFLASSRNDRVERARRMVEKLWGLGLPLDVTEVLSLAPGHSVGRPHVAQAMIRRGYVTSLKEAFDRYLTQGKPGYVERSRTPAALAIRAIKEAGGVPSLAHPGQYGHDEIIPSLVQQGLMGLEVYHSEHDAGSLFRYERVCLEYGLLAVGGSDYHGTEGLRSMGLGRPALPEARFEQLLAARAASQTPPVRRQTE